ncbi:hypothetical protein [Isoptericola variabilis]|uniref:Uncharacterized protein n=1 Tax=Isoptericola variabilis (strain 225) TaxID=743718 RepID=F6FVQ3_ISOV2|nr:hypothetical protein [Isoptericola variabilis]AEG45554.1 hypothetical protein Isova_2868 [Isoptericola variabilis 225]TWH25842.1 hypothetical protein L600_000900000920 [Isoptericola variabilis J7]
MTVKVDIDTDRWVYVPEAFPWNGYESPEHWSRTVARLAAEAFEYDAEERGVLERYLMQLLAYPRLTEGVHRFALLGTPDKTLELVQVVEAPTRDDVPADSLLGLPEPDATREPEITEISGGLGAGRRAIRHTRAEGLGGDIVASVNWAWRTDGSDVVVMYGTQNLVQLDRLLPVLDAFAASISLAEH